jgi:hypothetical protein
LLVGLIVSNLTSVLAVLSHQVLKPSPPLLFVLLQIAVEVSRAALVVLEKKLKLFVLNDQVDDFIADLVHYRKLLLLFL